MKHKIELGRRLGGAANMNDSNGENGLSPAPQPRSIKLFVRQGLTETGLRERTTIQSVLDLIASFPGLDVVTGTAALDAGSFKTSHESLAKAAFSPCTFRDRRLALLDSAQAMVVIRTGLSESTAFEIAYNIFGGPRIPIFFAVHRGAPIKTTLLQELGTFVPVTYVTFDDPNELRQEFLRFLDRVRDDLPPVIAKNAAPSQTKRNLVVSIHQPPAPGAQAPGFHLSEVAGGVFGKEACCTPVGQNVFTLVSEMTASDICREISKAYNTAQIIAVDSTNDEIAWSGLSRSAAEMAAFAPRLRK